MFNFVRMCTNNKFKYLDSRPVSPWWVYRAAPWPTPEACPAPDSSPRVPWTAASQRWSDLCRGEKSIKKFASHGEVKDIVVVLFK